MILVACLVAIYAGAHAVWWAAGPALFVALVLGTIQFRQWERDAEAEWERAEVAQLRAEMRRHPAEGER